MTKAENRKTCQLTGVDLFTGLDALQAEGGVDLAAKAQAAMLVATASKRKREDGDVSEGESTSSKHSHASHKGVKFRSGLNALATQKVKHEVEWAHHWLGKEFEANPVSFNQMKLGHYVSGEADILLHCDRPNEFRARLCLMNKLGYWAAKHDWPAARSIYAAIEGYRDWEGGLDI